MKEKEWGMRMEKNWIALMQKEHQLAAVMEMNTVSERYGLMLTEEEARLVVEERVRTLQETRRVEFGPGIISKIISEFCDSEYIHQDNYTEMLIRLQDIFYLYKNEMMDEISDEELLHFMKEQFETICYGDLEYLEGTVLSNFAQAIRAGYEGYKASDGYGEYTQFDEVKRWDYEVYMETLRDLCWR